MKLSDALKSSPWSKDNNRGIIKTGVDDQDDASCIEAGKGTRGNALNTITSALKGSTPVTSGLNSFYSVAGDFTNKFKDIETSKRPSGTVSEENDELAVQLAQLREETNKQSVLETKFGTYAGVETLLGTVGGLYVGTLGNSGIANAARGITSSLGLSGIGTLSTIVDKAVGVVKADDEAIKVTDFSNWKDFALLLAANKYTIETSAKPSLEVRSPNNKFNFITNKDEKDQTLIKEANNWQFQENDHHKDNSEEDFYITGGYISKEGVLGYLETNGNITPSSAPDKWIPPKYRKDNEGTNIISKARKPVSIINRIVKSTGGVDYFSKIENINEFELDGKTPINGTEIVTKAKVYDRVNSKFRGIGGLYVEPFYSNNVLNCFEIPFEFNPIISGDNMSAKYNTEPVMSRLLAVRSYSGSEVGDLTLETTYVVTAEAGKTSDNPWLNGWMSDWTPEKIRQIERQYRSLVLPYIDGKTFIRPPIIRINLRGENFEKFQDVYGQSNFINNPSVKSETKVNLKPEDSKIGDLFKYPANVASVTTVWDGETRDKRYIATNVSFQNIDDSFGMAYRYDDNGDVLRYGFKVVVTLAETTKNFLDFIPNYKDYLSNDNNEYFNDSVKISDNNQNNKGNLISFDDICKSMSEFNTLLNFDTFGSVKENSDTPVIFEGEEKPTEGVSKEGNLFVRLFKRSKGGQDKYTDAKTTTVGGLEIGQYIVEEQ